MHTSQIASVWNPQLICWFYCIVFLPVQSAWFDILYATSMLWYAYFDFPMLCTTDFLTPSIIPHNVTECWRVTRCSIGKCSTYNMWHIGSWCRISLPMIDTLKRTTQHVCHSLVSYVCIYVILIYDWFWGFPSSLARCCSWYNTQAFPEALCLGRYY